MQIAIVGLAGSGKTTVFNTLTRGHAETGGYGGVTLNVGVVKVPDDRLDRLAEIFKPKKIVQADVTYADLPAPPPSSEGHIGTEELPPDHLARLRDSDALLHVVRAFEDPSNPHPDGSVDPGPRRRAARSRVPARRPLDGRASARASQDERPARDAGRARSGRARGGRPPAHPCRAPGWLADTGPRPRGRRGEGDPRLPVPDPEARPGAAQRRRRRPRPGARPRRQHRRGLRPSPRHDRFTVREDRDGARRARARRSRRLHGRAGDRRVGPGPRHRAVVQAARARVVPDRRVPTRSAPGRSPTDRRPSTPPVPSTPISPVGSSAPRPCRTRTSSASARWPRRASTGSFARRGRPTGFATATSSRSCSAAERRLVADQARDASAGPARRPGIS